MNRINPLYVAFLLVVVLLVLLVQLHNAKDDYQAAKEEYKEVAALTQQLQGLKKVYADTKKIKRDLHRIFNNNLLKSANFKLHETKNALQVSTQSIDVKGLNYVMGKILNGAYNIRSLTIKKLSGEKASMQMEIKW